MKARTTDLYTWVLEFDKEEVEFLKREAEENNLTVDEILLMTLGMLFIGGYSNMVGKE